MSIIANGGGMPPSQDRVDAYYAARRAEHEERITQYVGEWSGPTWSHDSNGRPEVWRCPVCEAPWQGSGRDWDALDYVYVGPVRAVRDEPQA